MVKDTTLRKMRWKLFLLGIFKIPMVGFVRPQLLFLDQERVEVKIRYRRRTKNHLNSMYFGALAVGADIAAAIQAFYFVEQQGGRVSLAFKSVEGQFLMRAEGDVYFRSNQGAEILEALQRSEKADSRENIPINITCFNEEDECVATFVMELSVRVKTSQK